MEQNAEQQTRCGFVALIGAPNAGKSTITNNFVGSKVSIVSPKVQTTRTMVRGIGVYEQTQIIFIDTPGIFKPKRRLDRAMVSSAWSGVKDADIVVLVVDAISAFLADDVSMKRWGADVVFTGSQKALAVPPGISMMVLSSRAVERIYANRPACYYLDLKAALKNGERGQTPFTPAVGILIQINARLNQIKRDGFANVQAQIRAIAKDFRSRIGKYPFHIVSDSLSYAVTPLSPNNPEVSAHQLFLTLKDEYGIIICPNGGELADKVFRVGHIGHLTVEDNDALFRAFDDLMARGILKA